MQLKARVNARAKEAGIPAQMMMQNYLLERLLERLSESPWRDRVVVKGGVLISSLVGVAARTTMDLDATARGFSLTHESVGAMLALWKKFTRKNPYAAGIAFPETRRTAKGVMGAIIG